MNTGNVIIEDIKQTFRKGSYLTKLIYINLAVFLIVGISSAVIALGGSNPDASLFYLGNWMSLPSSLDTLLYKPWTIITYMFLHEGFLHIFFNLLILYWFGKIFLQYLDQKKLLSVYLMGGIVGGLTYVLVYNTFPFFEGVVQVSTNRGASASVMAIMTAAAFYQPQHEIFLMFLGRVKIYYVALFYIALDLIGMAGTNAGGSWAHLGGAFYGMLWVSQYKKGKNISMWFDAILEWVFTIFKPRSQMRVKYKSASASKPPRDDKEYNRQKQEKQQQVDEILDKISKNGYEALTKEEKDILFQAKNS